MKRIINAVVDKIKQRRTEYKQVILVRTDLKLPKGKMAAQAAHASVEAVFKGLKSDKDIVGGWHKEGMKKVVLKVQSEKHMLRYCQYAKDENILHAIITDAGHTVVEPGTKTCCALGPAHESDIDRITGDLALM
jgi:peptidyl-tRNA hydrolase, PTH2 family